MSLNKGITSKKNKPKKFSKIWQHQLKEKANTRKATKLRKTRKNGSKQENK